MSYLESVGGYQEDLTQILLELLESVGSTELEFTNPIITTFIYNDDYYEDMQPFREVEDVNVVGISKDGTVFMEDCSGTIEYKNIEEFDIYDIAAILDIIELGLFTVPK